jgi:1-acyl-sn-glycerol-3-phosphate acyltransferase
MKTKPGHHKSEKPVLHAVTRSAPRITQSYPFQTVAHLYFIFSGLWLSLRRTFHGYFFHTSFDPARERQGLIRRFEVYLNLLQQWGIIEISFIGFEEVSSWEGCIIAPNHPSIIDAILMIASVPRLDCVMNAKLLRNPITGGAAHLCDFIRNDALRSMIKTCKQRLSEGANILIFPEGTRTKSPPLNPIHPIYALVANCASAPIRTILIECDSDYFGHRFSYFRPALCPMRFRVTTGKVFLPENFTDPRALSEEIERYFRASLS